jgi:hypothetical protein
VGSYGGVITEIDGVTEIQTTWVVDYRLKNIDGLRFAPSGELFAVAIDSAKVHKIDPITKNVVEFADLSYLGITGMSGIAFHPVTGNVFVESPLENVIVELDPSGIVVNPQVASGFQFLGFIDFDPTGNNDGYLFGPDALSGQVFKINIATGEKTVIVDRIEPGPVGLIFDANGVLYFNMNYDQVTQGDVFRFWDMETYATQDPSIGDPITVTFQSRFDELMPYGAFLALDDNGPMLPDGRQFPLNLNPFILIAQSLLDGNGEAELDFIIPVDPSYVGLTVYFAFITYTPSPFKIRGMSDAVRMDIH